MTEDSNNDESDLYGDMEDAKLASPTNDIKNGNNDNKNKINQNNNNNNNTSKAQNGSTFEKINSSSNSYNNTEKKFRTKSLIDQVNELQIIVQNLQNENNILKRNIGTLYRTAKAELDRKDRQIYELKQQKQQIQQQQQQQS